MYVFIPNTKHSLRCMHVVALRIIYQLFITNTGLTNNIILHFILIFSGWLIILYVMILPTIHVLLYTKYSTIYVFNTFVIKPFPSLHNRCALL